MTTTNFFIPLSLRIDPKEKQNFIDLRMEGLRQRYEGTTDGLQNVGTVVELFPKTIKQTNAYVESLGLNLKVRTVNLFASAGNVRSTTIHADGLNYNGPTLLEARISYYEIADTPGVINWWEDMPLISRIVPASQRGPERINFIPTYHDDLKDQKITWNDVPAPTCSASTNVPSALLRTNVAHNVHQGPGLRITVSCQLVFKDDRPMGVWQHIQNNLDKILKV